MIAWLGLALASDVVKYETRSAVTHGKEIASVTFKPQVAGTFGFSVDCGAKRWSVPPADLVLGSTHVLELKGLPKGTYTCSGAIDVVSTESGQSGTLSFKSSFASLDALDWKATVEDVDLEAKTATAWASRPLTSAVATITNTDGTAIAAVDADLSDAQRPTFRWEPDGEVLQIAIAAEDVHGFRSSFELSPWSYEIPHEDVVFETNADAIRATEVGKLESTWADMETVTKKYGSYVEIELFVAGYTDTVGDPASNHALSEKRARSIAAWFRERGFSGPIHYQGFGESVLAVTTPDGTDEESNRRALYVLAASPPRTSPSLPRSNWRSL